MTKTKGKKGASKPDGRRTSIWNSTTPRMTKETASFIEKLHEKDSKRKKNKEHKKTEDGSVRRLAKQGLIDKAKAKAARKSSSKKKKKKYGSSRATDAIPGANWHAHVGTFNNRKHLSLLRIPSDV